MQRASAQDPLLSVGKSEAEISVRARESEAKNRRETLETGTENEGQQTTASHDQARNGTTIAGKKR